MVLKKFIYTGIDKSNYVNVIGTFRSEDAAHGKTGVRYRTSQNYIQPPHYLKFIDFWVCSVNLGTLRDVALVSRHLLCTRE